MNKLPSSDEIAIFLRVIERGGFAAAAEDTGLTPSGVSKAITRLEDRLGVRLLQRTTRRLILTPEGETMLARGREILASIEAAEAEVTAGRGAPRGLLRVNTGTAYGKHQLMPRLPEFRERYPDITLDLTIADRRIDLIGEQIDVAIRIGPMSDSSLVVRRIGTSSRAIVASPAYLKRYGTPRTAADLAAHICLGIGGIPGLSGWPLRSDGAVRQVQIKYAVTCDSAELLRDMAVQGLGLVRLARFMLADAIADGRLVEVFRDIHVSEKVIISAVMPSGRQNWPRVRAFVDFIAQGDQRLGGKP